MNTNKQALVQGALNSFVGDDFAEIPQIKTKLVDQKNFGQMEREEKILYTLFKKSLQKVKEIMEKATGQNPDGVPRVELLEDKRKLEKLQTPLQKRGIEFFQNKANILKDAMWERITARVTEKNGKKPSAMVLLPGYEIVTGITEEGLVATSLSAFANKYGIPIFIIEI